MDLDETLGIGTHDGPRQGMLVYMELVDFKLVMLSIGGSMRARIEQRAWVAGLAVETEVSEKLSLNVANDAPIVATLDITE